jgi:WD40 repeat protein
LKTGIPPDLEAIALRCLEKSPSRRFPTAGAMADALDLFLAGKPISEPDRTTERIVIPRRRQLPLALAAAGIGLGLMALAALVTWVAARRAHQTETLPLRVDREAAVRAERRARLEEGIARCEAGHIAEGVRRIQTLGPDDTLPVNEVLAAWNGCIPARTALQPPTPAAVVAVSPAGEFTATAEGRTVRIWRVADSRLVGDGWTADGRVTALAWEDGGTRLAVGTETGKVVVGAGIVAPFAPATVVDPGDLHVTALALDPYGVRAAFGTAPVVRWYDDEEGLTTEPLPATDPVSSVALGPGGTLAVATRAGSVRLFDPDGRRWLDLPADGDATAVAYGPEGNAIAVGTKTGAVRLWDAVARVPLTDAADVGGPVTALSVAISASDYVILVATDQPAVSLRCRRPFLGGPIRLPEGPDEQVLSVAFSPGGGSLFVTSPSGVSVWRVGDTRHTRAGAVSAGGRYASWLKRGRISNAVLSGSPDRPEAVVVAGSGGRLHQVDPAKDTDLSASTAGADVTAVAAGPGGRVCAVSQGKGKATLVRHWASGLNAAASESDFESPVWHAAFLPDGTGIVLACGNGMVHIVDPVTGRDLRPPLACRSPVLAVAVDEEGSRILAGCADGTAHLWDRGTGAELHVVRHRAEVRGVAFTGTDLLTASADGTARRWHAATGLPLGPPMHHADALTALAAWGKLVATGGRDRVVRVWRIP